MWRSHAQVPWPLLYPAASPPTLLQFAALTQLRELTLFCTAYTPASQAGLSALAGSLTALEINECNTAPLPATLASLNNLACLTLVGLHIGTPLAEFGPCAACAAAPHPPGTCV